MRKTALIWLIALIFSTLTASAVQMALVAPKNLSTITGEQFTIIIASNTSFNGVLLINCTNCITLTAVGFSAQEFAANKTIYMYRKELQIIGVQPGNYTARASVHNLTNHRIADAAAKGVAGSFDKQAPVIGIRLPTGIVYSGYINLTISTNEPAECRTDQSSSNYDLMTTRMAAGGILHSTLFLLEKGDYKFNIACRDKAGNTGKTETIEFTVDPPPTAEIRLSDNTPVKAGILEIDILSSEPLKQTPSLTVDFDGGEQKTISLTGSQKNWKGYLVIAETGDERIGSFHFSGQDLQGQTGTTITSGALFIADTKKPPAPQGLIAGSHDNIELEWHYEGEPVQHYKIYRSVSPGVQQSNYLGESSTTKYVDREVTGGITYHYRTSAVDSAGNEGQMSDEASAASTRAQPKQENTAQKQVILSAPLALKVNNTINYVGNLYLDVEWARISIADSQEARSAAEDTGVMESIISTKAKLDQYKTQLKDLWYMDLEEKELDKRVNNILQKTDELKKTTPASIRITERAVLAQALTQQQIDESINSILLGKGFSQEETTQYREAMTRLQEQYRVSSDILVLETTNLDGSGKNLTLIRKTIKDYTASPAEIQVIEHIPKEFARHADEIVFITPGYQIIEADPIISWREKSEIKYYVNRRANLDDAKQAGTIVLTEPRKTAPIISNATPTGLATKESPGLFSPTESIMILIGLVLVLGLAVYYFVASGASIHDIRAEQYARKYMAKARKAEHPATATEKDNEYYYARLMLRRGAELVQQNKLEKATTLYHELKEIYPRLEQSHREEIYESCAELHTKISRAKQ